MIRVMAAKELKLLFYSPISWLFLALFQLIATWLFFIQIDQFVGLQGHMINRNVLYTVTDQLITPFFQSLGIMVMIFLPFLSMSMVSREYQGQTFALLQCAPISAWDIILGKYLALLFYVLVILCIALSMSAVLSVGTVLDWSKIAACVLALGLLMMAMMAMGLFFSTLTEQPVVAGLATLGVVFLLMLFGWDQTSADSLLAYLSLQQHYNVMTRGLIATTDLVFFILFTSVFLAWSVYRLASLQWFET